MGYKARKRLALFILVIGLPAYIVLAVSMMGIAPGFAKPIELLIYVLLGVAWIFPVKWVFKGIGQDDPDA